MEIQGFSLFAWFCFVVFWFFKQTKNTFHKSKHAASKRLTVPWFQRVRVCLFACQPPGNPGSFCSGRLQPLGSPPERTAESAGQSAALQRKSAMWSTWVRSSLFIFFVKHVCPAKCTSANELALRSVEDLKELKTDTHRRWTKEKHQLEPLNYDKFRYIEENTQVHQRGNLSK